jgi:hypothetical protein
MAICSDAGLRSGLSLRVQGLGFMAFMGFRVED